MSTSPALPSRRVPPPPAPMSARPDVVSLRSQGSVKPPPVPPRSPVLPARSTTGADVAKLLARRPPPPPARRHTEPSHPSSPQQLPPAIPSRKLPVPQTSLLAGVINMSLKPVKDVDIPVSSTPSLNGQSISCLQCRDFSRADAHAALFPRQGVHSLEDLARNLTKPFNNDFDRARVIFTWLHHNVVYDVEGPPSATAERTFSSGKAASDGYAVLFEHLTELIGLQCHKVTGHGKEHDFETPSQHDSIPEMMATHTWNCVMLEGSWHLVDACWGAGVRQGTTWQAKFNPAWFIASPLEFATKHFPEDPSFQLTPEQITWEEYIAADPGPTLSSHFSELDLHPLRVEPATKHIVEKRFTKFSVSKRCEHVSVADDDNYVFVLTTGNAKDMTPLSYNEEEQAWTATFFTPRNGSVMLYAIDTINSKDAKGLGLGGFLKAKGKKAMTTKEIATWTIVHL